MRQYKKVSTGYGLTRETIKYIAMFTMLLNHISFIFMESGKFWSEVFIDIGYFTAGVMCYFLVEGFRYTHSRKLYAMRLFLFAVISEFPYCLAFGYNLTPSSFRGNMIFTLFLCFLILCVKEYVKIKEWQISLIFLLVAGSVVSDWALMAPAFTLFFSWAGEEWRKKKTAFVLSACLYGAFSFFAGLGRVPMGKNLVYMLGGMTGIVLSGVVILYFYSGKQIKRGRKFSKWFFYLFYPAHLLILGVIRMM